MKRKHGLLIVFVCTSPAIAQTPEAKLTEDFINRSATYSAAVYTCKEVLSPFSVSEARMYIKSKLVSFGVKESKAQLMVASLWEGVTHNTQDRIDFENLNEHERKFFANYCISSTQDARFALETAAAAIDARLNR